MIRIGAIGAVLVLAACASIGAGDVTTTSDATTTSSPTTTTVPPTTTTTLPDYSLDELIGVLEAAEICSEVTETGQADDGEYAFCEIPVPDEQLIVMALRSEDARIEFLVGAAPWACMEASAFVFRYVYGPTWFIAPESDELANRGDLELWNQVQAATGGLHHIYSCEEFFMRDYQAEEIYGSDWNAWSVDVKRALLDEPGSDPTLLEP